MDPHYDNKPSMISETSFDRPNRYRSEAPLYYACYGALQDSNGFDSSSRSTPIDGRQARLFHAAVDNDVADHMGSIPRRGTDVSRRA